MEKEEKQIVFKHPSGKMFKGKVIAKKEETDYMPYLLELENNPFRGIDNDDFEYFSKRKWFKSVKKENRENMIFANEDEIIFI